MKQTVEIQEFINRRPLGALQKTVFALCFLTAFFDGADTAVIGYVAPALAAGWGIGREALAPVRSEALCGLAAGAVLSGPAADRIGRRAVLVSAVLLFSLFGAATSLAQSAGQMMALRFAAGVGLGAAMPCAVTLLAEYSPVRRRSSLVNTMFCGFPLGASAAGFFASWLVPLHGWRPVLLWCGLLPLVLGVLMLFVLPESAVWLAVRGRSAKRVASLMARLGADAGAAFSVRPSETARGARPLAVVLGRHFRAGSLLLWTAYFCGLVVFYAMLYWRPVLFAETRMPQSRAAAVSGLFALGGLGAVYSGYLMDRFNGSRLVALLSLGTALSVAAVGQALHCGEAALVAAVLAAGVMQNTVQTSLPALAARFYPPECRTTGVSWMLGIGRFGAVAGTFLVGALLSLKLSLPAVFAVLSLPALLLSACLLVKQRLYGD